MPAYKLNLGIVRDCLKADELAVLLKAHGWPEDQPCGVLDVTQESPDAIAATLVVAGEKTIKRVDRKSGASETTTVKKHDTFPFVVRYTGDGMGLLETLAGGDSSIEKVGGFLSRDLATSMRFEQVGLDLVDTYRALQEKTGNCLLKQARIAGYRVGDKFVGPYTPRFANSEDGVTLLEQSAANAKCATLAWRAKHGKVSLTLKPAACFGFSCKVEDRREVEQLLRALVLVDGMVPKE